MPQIQFRDKVEEVQIGQLFSELGYDDLEPTERPNEWSVEVLSFDGFYSIEGFRTVEPQGTFLLETECGKRLEGADDHIVLEHSGWTKMKDLRPGDRLISHDHSPVIAHIEHRAEKKKLYDLQVATAHSFMTNGVLSHNSHFLVALGANAMRVGKNVVHYTFELTETAVGIRYDSNLCNIPSNDVPDSKELIMSRYEKMELGRLIIKEYPTGSASVNTIRNHLEKVMMKGFIPSLVVIDYADVMKSTRQFDSLRHELKLIYEELRNLSMDMNIPIWTASQSNRSGATSDVVGLENMSEAYGKAMVADVVLSLSRKPMEKDKGVGRLFIAKNRAGRDGVLFPVAIDTARSKFEIQDPSEISLTEAMAQDESAMKSLLKQKWREVSGN
jgi:hypothetical protein